MISENAKKYTAVVCAAGQGKRFGPLTGNIPKTLLRVGDKTILEYLLDNFSKCGLTDVLIVVGYKGDMIEKKIGDKYKNCRITYIHNKDYEITDNFYSLYLAKEKISSGMIFFNADIIFNKNILIKLINDAYPNGLVTDNVYNAGAGKNPVRVKMDGRNRISDIGHDIGGQNKEKVFGIYKLSSEATKRYFEIAAEFFKEGPGKGGFWWPIKRTALEIPFFAVSAAPYGWVSINNVAEYEKAVFLVNSILGKL